jgi:hypothetical protein
MALTTDDKKWIVDTVVLAVKESEYNLHQGIRKIDNKLVELKGRLSKLEQEIV